MKLGVLIFSILCILAAAPVHAGQPLVLYDDFSKPLIDPQKWTADDWGFVLENTRVVTKNWALNLAARSYAGIDSDSGSGGSGNAIYFKNPQYIDAIKTTVVFKDYDLIGCTTNSFPSQVRARISGYFFNTGSRTEGSHANDVFAQVYVYRNSQSQDASKVLKAVFWVGICRDRDCFDTTPLGSYELGNVILGKNTDLRLEWDPDGNQFIAQLNKNPEVSISYEDLPDVNHPGLASKRLEARTDVAECTSEPRPTAFVDLWFDNVYVNQSALNYF